MDVLEHTRSSVNGPLQVPEWHQDQIQDTFIDYLTAYYIRVHVLEDKVEVPVVIGPMDIVKPDNVRMITKCPQEDDFSESSLSIGLISECIENLLDGHLQNKE